ncbi:hypothetical protein D3C87_1736900 [compost metagenome]
MAFVRRECDFLHRFAGVDQAWKILRDGINAFDNVMLDIALVRDTDFFETLARNQTVGANKPQHAGEHLIAAGSVMAVDDDDFRRLRLADPTIAA